MSQILLVTGGSRGIGAAVCRRAAKEGYSVAVNFHRDLISANYVVDDINELPNVIEHINDRLNNGDTP